MSANGASLKNYNDSIHIFRKEPNPTNMTTVSGTRQYSVQNWNYSCPTVDWNSYNTTDPTLNWNNCSTSSNSSGTVQSVEKTT